MQWRIRRFGRRIGCTPGMVAWVLLFASSHLVWGQEATYSAAQVKATFLYHFAAYTEWPEGRKPGSRLTIGIAGAPVIAEELGRLLPGRTVRGRIPVVKEIVRHEDLADVDMLFIGEAQNDDVRRWTAAGNRGGMLVVTDSPAGLPPGAMINLLLIDRRVQFEVSLAAAEKHGFRISSRLLSVAIRVRKGELGPESRYACFPAGLSAAGLAPTSGAGPWALAARGRVLVAGERTREPCLG